MPSTRISPEAIASALRAMRQSVGLSLHGLARLMTDRRGSGAKRVFHTTVVRWEKSGRIWLHDLVDVLGVIQDERDRQGLEPPATSEPAVALLETLAHLLADSHDLRSPPLPGSRLDDRIAEIERKIDSLHRLAGVLPPADDD